ncbi:hypothetical protein RRG08_046604 [Elysia crispata]|uniref:Uncharacterized protein n=1 Tax=Elysia crispata TaxID=231223 RepID=A0AAE1AP59_9GAST|nr:hypothetical protein RRG08_046604 [Elysia crispata]
MLDSSGGVTVAPWSDEKLRDFLVHTVSSTSRVDPSGAQQETRMFVENKKDQEITRPVITSLEPNPFGPTPESPEPNEDTFIEDEDEISQDLTGYWLYIQPVDQCRILPVTGYTSNPWINAGSCRLLVIHPTRGSMQDLTVYPGRWPIQKWLD